MTPITKYLQYPVLLLCLLWLMGCGSPVVEQNSDQETQPSDQASADDGGSSSQSSDDGNSATATEPSDPANVHDPSDPAGVQDPVTPTDPSDPTEPPEEEPCVETTYYHDVDGDSYGDPADSILSCLSTSSYVSNSSDCNDANASIKPGATETCDNIDNDCDGSIDEAVKNTYYHDVDDDGYGDPADSILSCLSQTSYVSNSSDCDDTSSSIKPGAIETCDSIDNDCDGNVDEDLWPSDVGFSTVFARSPLDIGADLISGYEPSGVVWHSGLDQLFVVSDGGIVTKMNSDGSGVVDKTIGGDFEGITVANPSTDFVYIGVEHPDSIREYNIETQEVTRTFSLVAYMTSADNAGLEALTFVSDSGSSEGGYFYAGLQETGEVFVFELPILSSTTSTNVHFVHSFSTPYSDIAGMFYDENNDVLYAIYDGANKLVAMNPNDGTTIDEWSLPSATQDQEGFAIGDSCHVFIAEDTRTVWRY